VLDLLASTRSTFGAAPRKGDAVSQASKVATPAWLRPADPLYGAECERARVLEQGRVVRSWVVMANALLFTRGSSSHPALVVYAPGDDVDAETLEEVAAEIFRRRGSTPVDAELRAFVKDLADPARPFLRSVPAAMANGRALFVTTVLILREHLPRPYLAASLLPLVVHEVTRAAIVLPSWLWGSDLRAAWVDLAADQ
jgi:hypothetical protein